MHVNLLYLVIRQINIPTPHSALKQISCWMTFKTAKSTIPSAFLNIIKEKTWRALRECIHPPRPNTCNIMHNNKKLCKNIWIQTVIPITNKIESSVPCGNSDIRVRNLKFARNLKFTHSKSLVNFMKKMMFLSKNWYFSVQTALIYYTVNKSHLSSFILLVFSHVANFRYVANFRFLTLLSHENFIKICPQLFKLFCKQTHTAKNLG